MDTPEPAPEIVLVRRTPGERKAYRDGALAALAAVRRRLPKKVGKYAHTEITTQIDLAERRFRAVEHEDPR